MKLSFSPPVMLKINGMSNIAHVRLIDGQALEPSAFAESVNGVQIPKQYEGEYGNNGFHLDFEPENLEYSGDTITRVLRPIT